MKIIAFNSSPHRDKGQTHTMIVEFFKGAKKAGASTEQLFLIDYRIQPCMACTSCWIKSPGTCALEDDMGLLQEKFLSADIVIFASPLYIDNVTGTMKLFMDRLFMPIEHPHFEKDENGETRHKRSYRDLPKIMAMSNNGSPEQSQFQVLRLLFKRIARNLNLDLLAEIYCAGGSLLLREAHPYLHNLKKYKELLLQAGEEVVTNMSLSADTSKALQQSIIPSDNYVDEFIRMGNQYFDTLSQSSKHHCLKSCT